MRWNRKISPDDITKATANIFAAIAQSMRERDVDSLEVARFPQPPGVLLFRAGRGIAARPSAFTPFATITTEIPTNLTGAY